MWSNILGGSPENIERICETMPKRGENIRKRKDGRWEGRYICDRSIDGKAKYRSVYAKTYTEVRQLLAEAKGGAVVSKRLTPVIRTFGFAAEQWLTACSLRLKHSTIVKYSALLTKHILPHFKNTSLIIITENTVAQFITSKSAELSSSTVHSLLSIIKSVLRYAQKQGWYGGTAIDLKVTAEKRRCVSSLTNDECRALEDFLLDNMDCTKLGLYICLYTGLRIGELCALRWKNIDLEHKILHITSTIQRIRQIDNTDSKTTLLITPPKSATSVRDIPIPLKLSEILKGYVRSDDCFLLSKTSIPVEPRTMQNRFKKYAHQLGLEYSNPHVLRHTFATQCIALGFDAKTLSEILGHSRVEITLNRYVHSSDERKRTQMELLFDKGQNNGI